MRIIDSVLAEMDMEAKTTRKFLEAMPADQMNYKPHEKSMSAGQLAMHVATIPGHLAEWANVDEFSMSGGPQDKPEPTKEAILKAFDESLAKAKTIFSSFDDAKCMGNWSFVMGGKTAMSMPRMVMIRSFVMNHLYHHRGQFGVYLRLMGAKVPASYGPSVDENPFAEMMEAATAKA